MLHDRHRPTLLIGKSLFGEASEIDKHAIQTEITVAYPQLAIEIQYLIYIEIIFLLLPRDAMLARYIPSSCVYLSVCVCVRHARYCIETTIPRITQTTRHKSHSTQGFCGEKSGRNSNGVTTDRSDKRRWGRLKSASFDKELENGMR